MKTDLNKTIDTSYLQFDAYNMKDLITRYLSEDQNFTDQVYAGSNLSILIDIFSQHFQVMMYYLNHSAGESTFSDTSIYENMNRIVKLLNYSPQGYTTSSGLFSLTGITTDNNGKVLPPYTNINTGMTDDDGNLIYYSTVDYYYVYDDNTAGDDSNVITMYNGQWKSYDRTFVAEGVPYETFTLSNIVNDADNNQYAAYPYIDVWVKRFDVDGEPAWTQYKPTTGGLFFNGESQSIYGSTDTYFDLRLNEYKQYEIKFGDGIHGAPLEFGDELFIVYLTSNGQSGEIQSGDVSDKTGLKHNVVGLNDTIVSEWFSSISDNIADMPPIQLTNNGATSATTKEGDVDDIRENAPQWFKSQGRLITQQDFEHFIRSNFFNDVVDIKVMNNWGYMSTFYAWLYNIGVTEGDPQKYLNNQLKTKYDYVWADSCDSNNVYMWVRMKNDSIINKTQMDAKMKPLKVLTAETVFVDPLDVKFIPCAYNNGYNIASWDTEFQNFIEIYIDNSVLISAESVKTTVNQLIVDYFKEQNQKIGALIDFNDLYNQIRSVRGVKRIRTIYHNGDVKKIVDGLSFAFWTATIIAGSDTSITNGTIKLEEFQFPELNESSIIDRIKVITDSVYQNTTIEY